MTVGILETEHFETAYPLIRLFDNEMNKIIIFTNEETYRQFQYLLGNDCQRYEWVIQQSAESKYKFIWRMYRRIKRLRVGLLFLNTISNNFIVYACMIGLLGNTRSIVTLHAINNYFRFKPAFSLRRWVRHTGKRALIKVTKEFNVISGTMVNYLTDKLPAHKIVHNLPGAVFEEHHWRHTTPAIHERINLVVPGSVDARRRDYAIVFELLEYGRHLPLNITLLGPFADPFGNSIHEKCMQYAAKHHNLFFYDRLVDQPEFDRVMNDAHIVLAPSAIDTVMVDEIAETYGKSICSGNIFDAVKYARPFITPQALTIPANLTTSAITYTHVQHIVQALESMHRDPARYEELLQQALHNSKEYTIGKVRSGNPTLF